MYIRLDSSSKPSSQKSGMDTSSSYASGASLSARQKGMEPKRNKIAHSKQAIFFIFIISFYVFGYRKHAGACTGNFCGYMVARLIRDWGTSPCRTSIPWRMAAAKPVCAVRSPSESAHRHRPPSCLSGGSPVRLASFGLVLVYNRWEHLNIEDFTKNPRRFQQALRILDCLVKKSQNGIVSTL